MNPRKRMTSAEFQATEVPEHAQSTAGRRWSAAKATTCAAGHRHPSKMESRVCARLTAECAREGTTLYQQARIPLWTLAPGKRGRPLVLSVDFAIVRAGQLVRLVDAKAPGRISRDWRRGAAAAEAATGITIEEVDR